MSTMCATVMESSAPPPELNDLLNDTLPLVKFLASRLAARLPAGVDAQDLVQAGLMGLLQCAGRFDPSRGIKFQTYANRRVQGAMLDYLRSLDWAPRSVRSRSRKLEKACHDAEQRAGGRPNDEEVAQEIGISFQELEEWSDDSLLHIRERWSQDIPLDIESVPDPADSPEETVEKEQMRSVLIEAIERLPKNERLVLTLYYYEQLTMQEIGETIGLRQARISQLHSKAVLRLRKRLSRLRPSGARLMRQYSPSLQACPA